MPVGNNSSYGAASDADGRVSVRSAAQACIYHMFRKLAFNLKNLCSQVLPPTRWTRKTARSRSMLGQLQDWILLQEAKSIYVARQQRALASTVEYIEKNMPLVESVKSRPKLLTKAFGRADTSGDRLICEFGVFKGVSINHIAKLTGKIVFGFDSFEGLPEKWGDGWKKGEFAVARLPKVRSNVTLIKGWFNESLPPFLKQNRGSVGFLHVDCDLYSSTKTIFELLEPRLGRGTVIVFDEYFNYPQWEGGEFKAFQEFLSKTRFSCEFIGYHRNGEQVAVILN